MTTYQRKSQHTITATRFTPQLGEQLRMHALGQLEHRPDAPELLVYSEQGGFRMDGNPVSFGDYIVGHAIVAASDFEATWEPVFVSPVEAPKAAEPVAVPVAAPRTRRAASES